MTKIITIEGMMCKNCQRHVKEAIEGFGLKVSVSLEDGIAKIEDCTVSNKEIKSAIEDLGFDVVEIKNER